MGDLVLRDLLIVIAVAIPIVLIAHSLNLSTIVGFLLTGVLIGPEGLGLIDNVQRINILAEVGIALLLFHIGLEFSVSNLKGLRRVIFGSGVLQVVLTICAGLLFSFVFNWSIQQGIFFGCAAALSSTAFTLSFLSYKRWLDSPSGRISTGMLILQDLAIVPMLTFLPFLVGEKETMIYPGSVIVSIFIPIIEVAVVFGVLWLIYRFLVSRLLYQVVRIGSKELFVIILIGVALGFAWFTKQLGLSFALGAFLGGLMISATPFRFQALSEIAPFRACVSGIFFVAIGMLISPTFFIQNIGQISALVAFIVIAKTLISAGSVFVFGYPLSVALVVGMLLGQMGEFSFLLAMVGFREGIVGEHLYNLLITASGVTLVIAPVMMELSVYVENAFRKFSYGKLKKEKVVEEEKDDVKEHAIICGFGPLGITIGHMLEKSGISYIIVELNPVTAKRLIKSKRNVRIGDGSNAVLLLNSRIEKARLLAIAVPDYINAIAIVRQARRLNHQIIIVARSRYRSQVNDLYGAGADIVICEELEGGIEMGRHVLLQLGVIEESVNQFVSEIKSFGSADFF